MCASCNFNNEANTDDNELVLPGKDRVWWYQGFEDLTEVHEFITQLKNTNKNEDFNFGISNFEVPSIYKHFSTTFSGHIDINSSHEEDIFNSTYDDFWIESIFNENTTISPIYNRFSIYYYPFYYRDNVFDNNNVKYEVITYNDGSYDVIFTYEDNFIMKAKLTKESASQIDKD